MSDFLQLQNNIQASAKGALGQGRKNEEKLFQEDELPDYDLDLRGVVVPDDDDDDDDGELRRPTASPREGR